MSKTQPKRTKRAKKKTTEKSLTKGIIHIHSSFNNTIVTLTDLLGNVVSWVSAGSIGFKGTKKGTPFAAAQATKTLIEQAKPLGLSEVEIRVKGVGVGRESALRTLVASGLSISKIADVTPIPFGGVKPKKPRRV